jgi:RecA/RadA recombinase
MPAGRVLTLAGSSGCGKSYLALSFCRNAQKKGYTPLYLDSESAIDIDFVKRLGCDPNNFILRQVSTTREVSSLIANVCKSLMDLPEKEREEKKMIIVLDSLGNLTSDKEYSDTLDGTEKRDMTKQQEIKALFRTNATALGKLGIPFIICSHTYQTLDLYSKAVVSGGTGLSYNASLTLLMSTSKYEDKESEKIVENKVGDYTKLGVIVTAKPEKSRFTIPQKVQFQIPYFKAPNPYIGLEKYLTWENSGILEGILLSKKDYDKLSDKEKETVKIFEKDCETFYAFPKVAGITKNRTIVVSHLGKQLPLNMLFTPQVFTDELLHKLDDEVIRPNFELPSQESFDDLSEFVDTETGEIIK